MSKGYVECLMSQEVNGPTLTASAVATSLLPGQAKYVLPSNFFDVGKRIRLKGMIQMTNIVTTPGTFTLDVRLNSTPIVVFNGGAMQLSSTAHTTLPLWFEINLLCRAVGNGTATNLMGWAVATSQVLEATAVADSVNTHPTLIIPNVTPVVGNGFDCTLANIVDVFGTFSLNNANAATMVDYYLESLN